MIPPARRRIISALALTALALAGCSAPRAPGSYRIDDSMSAKSHASRVEIIVLHYTASSMTRALATLTNRDVSAHYVVSDDSPPVVYRLVGEELTAWHAGESSWYGRTYINPRSIGIEIVHPGWNTSNPPGPEFRWPQRRCARAQAGSRAGVPLAAIGSGRRREVV